MLAAVAEDSEHPAQCIVLGRNAPIDRVEHWLTVAAHRHFVGFAVGRTIWEEPLHQYLGGEITADQVIERVAGNYSTLVDTYTRATFSS